MPCRPQGPGKGSASGGTRGRRPRADPFPPGPGGRKDAEVYRSAGEGPGQADNLLLSDSKGLLLAPGTAPTCPCESECCERSLSPLPYP